MVARFSRFRITYLISFLTGKPKTFFIHVAVLLFSATVAIFLAWLPTVLSSDNLENLYILDVLVGSVSVSLIVAIPFFISRWNLDPRSLQSVPKPLANVAVGFLISAIFSWPFLGALTWVSAWVYFRKATLPVSAATIIVVLVTLTFMLVTTRFSASLTEILFNTDRKRKLRNLIAVVLLSVLTPIVINVFNSVSKPEDAEALNELVNFVEFTPAGLPFYTLQNISNGNTYEVIFGLSLSVMMLALVSGVTISLLIRQLRSVPRPDDSSFTTLRLGWFEVLPATPTGAIGARSIIYWLKDPRYRVSLLAIPIIPFSVVAILKFAGVSTAFLSFVPLPLVLIMVAWMLHNDVANDSTAFWMHVSSGVRGWQDRLGRLVPVFLLGIPILVVGTGASVVLSGDWQLAPSFFALGAVSLCASAAVSSVVSVLLPYPATRPDESPFLQPQWQGFGSGFAQTVSLLATVALIAPVIWFVVFNSVTTSLKEQATFVGASLGYGLILLLLGVSVGGMIYKKKASDILNLMQVFD